VFQAFDAEEGRDWATEYRNSAYYQRYIAKEMSGQVAPAAGRCRRPPRRQDAHRFAQLSTLCRRYMAVIAATGCSLPSWCDAVRPRRGDTGDTGK